MIYPLRIAPIFIRIFSRYIWRIPNNKKEIYLTFDDGPHPEITEWVIDLLNKYDAKATFFCVGENVVKYPKVIQTIIDSGNIIGNHSYNHLNGYSTRNNIYLDNVKKAAEVIKSNLFRPPYGKIRKSQSKKLENYKIIMWTLLCGDFNPRINAQKTLDKMVEKTRPGDIIVFHDSEKSEKNLKFILPSYIEQLSKKGFVFKSL